MTQDEIKAVARELFELMRSEFPDKFSTGWMSRDQYAKTRSISVSTVDRMIKAGQLKTKPAGRRVLIKVD